MTFFVDANIVIYAAVRSPQRAACLEVLAAVASGRADGQTSAAVLEEVWYIERSGKAGDLDGLTERAYRIFTPLLAVTDQAFRLALESKSPAGTNDRVHAGTCLAHGIDVIVSADADFDEHGRLRRVDPSNARAVRRLLRSEA